MVVVENAQTAMDCLGQLAQCENAMEVKGSPHIYIRFEMIRYYLLQNKLL